MRLLCLGAWYVKISFMKQYDLPIIIEQDEDGYFVFCPALQGCYSQGKTYEEAMLNINDAVALHVRDRLEEKEEIPQTKSLSLSTVHISL